MANNFKTPTKGQPLTEFLQEQALWQTIHDAIDRIGKLELQLKQLPKQPAKRPINPNPVLPLAINRTGIDLGNVFSIVSYDEPFVDSTTVPPTGYAPAIALDTTYFAKKPNNISPWGVFTGPLPIGGIAPIVIQGVAHVQIEVVDVADTRAIAIVDDCTRLASSSDCKSPARILWKEPGTGLKWASILIGQGDCIDTPDICYEKLEKFQMRSNWVAGIAIAKFWFAGQSTASGGTVAVIRDELLIFADQLNYGKWGLSIKTCDGKHYAIQASCAQATVIPSDPIGTCAYGTSGSAQISEADCIALSGTWTLP